MARRFMELHGDQICRELDAMRNAMRSSTMPSAHCGSAGCRERLLWSSAQTSLRTQQMLADSALHAHMQDPEQMHGLVSAAAQCLTQGSTQQRDSPSSACSTRVKDMPQSLMRHYHASCSGVLTCLLTCSVLLAGNAEPFFKEDEALADMEGVQASSEQGTGEELAAQEQVLLCLCRQA